MSRHSRSFWQWILRSLKPIEEHTPWEVIIWVITIRIIGAGVATTLLTISIVGAVALS